MAHANSIKSHRENKQGGMYSSVNTAIIVALQHGRHLTLRDLVAVTGYPINTISGRVSALKDVGLVEVAYKMQCGVTRKTVSVLRLSARGEVELVKIKSLQRGIPVEVAPATQCALLASVSA